MNIIITMAGEGSRFKAAGYTAPKFRVEVRGLTLFEWSVRSLQNFYPSHFIFIAQKTDDAKSFIKDRCDALGVRSYTIEELNGPTAGQAETVLKAENILSDSERPLLIYNIDTSVDPSALQPSLISGDGWVPSFKCEGTHWSFVDFDCAYRVTNIKEKERISEFGTIGLYYFSSFTLFRECFRRCSYSGYKERYVAPLYAEMLKMPQKLVMTTVIPSHMVHPLGTPEEVRRFEAQRK
jgi:dTDP-glucose pyrophosphorylase